jgi:hypothetical protein
MEVFRLAVGDAPCVLCGRSDRRRDGHHVVPQASVRQIARARGFTEEQRIAVLWSVENMVPLCSGPQACHMRVEARFVVLPWGKVPRRCWVFAAVLGEPAPSVLRRLYPRVEGDGSDV